VKMRQKRPSDFDHVMSRPNVTDLNDELAAAFIRPRTTYTVLPYDKLMQLRRI
jgi:hypothetical protein